MVNIVWGVFIIIGISFAFLTGKIDIINDQIISSGKDAMNLMMEMIVDY